MSNNNNDNVSAVEYAVVNSRTRIGTLYGIDEITKAVDIDKTLEEIQAEQRAGHIATIVHAYRGNDYHALASRLRDHNQREFTLEQVEIYERVYSATNATTLAVDVADGNNPDIWLRHKRIDFIQGIPVVIEPPKPEWSKEKYLHTIQASNELRSLVANLTDKKEILKAVFDYKTKPKGPVIFRQNPKVLEFIRNYNTEINRMYYELIEAFYDVQSKKYEEMLGKNDDFFKVDYVPQITRGKLLEERILKHPLFKVVKIERRMRMNRDQGLFMRIETRDDVYFMHEGNRLNFGKYSFTIGIDKRQVRFNTRSTNFRGNAGPYLSRSSVCMGSESQLFSMLLRQQNIYEAMTLLYTTMTHFNPDSGPFRGLDSFFQHTIEQRLFRMDGSKAQFTNAAINFNEEAPF